MNLVDWVLLGAVLVFALIGWRRGFVAGLFSFAGFLGAGLLVALILPRFVEGTDIVAFNSSNTRMPTSAGRRR